MAIFLPSGAFGRIPDVLQDLFQGGLAREVESCGLIELLIKASVPPGSCRASRPARDAGDLIAELRLLLFLRGRSTRVAAEAAASEAARGGRRRTALGLVRGGSCLRIRGRCRVRGVGCRGRVGSVRSGPVFAGSA